MSALEVRLGSVRVGILERFNDWDYRFSFDESWLRMADAPVLGQLFEDRKPGDIESTGNLICWFDHLLPQGPLRRAVAKQARCDEDDEFNLLQLLGEDLPGAVILTPCLPRLSREAGVSRVQAPHTAEGLLRSSLAGAQYKLSVREGERGLTLPVQGQTGSYIAKFHDPLHKELPRVELATMLWARASGLSVPPCRQARAEEFVELPDGTPIGDGTVFLIERFDRLPGGERVHIEDLGQVLDRPPGDPGQFTGRYEHIAAVLAQLAPDDLRPFCERLVFCVLCGNTDAHLKNWSLIYPDKRHPRLSPAYDLIASILYVPPLGDGLALDLGGSRRFEDVRVESFRLLAEVADRPFDEVAGWVRQAAERVREAWHEHAAELPYRSKERARIDEHMARVPLATASPSS